MRLNTIRPALGAKTPAKRVGRGIGCGKGKTCGKGHKGQRARAGGFHKLGFEGGQMPLQRRLPKFGFRSRKSLFCEELRLSDLNKLTGAVVDFAALRAEGIIKANTKLVKIIGTGKVDKSVKVRGIPVTKGARAAIEAAGGAIEE